MTYELVVPTCWHCGKEQELTDDVEVTLPNGDVRYTCSDVCAQALLKSFTEALNSRA